MTEALQTSFTALDAILVHACAVIVLVAGALSAELMAVHEGLKVKITKKLVGQFIVAYFVACIPISFIAYRSFIDEYDYLSLYIAIVPLFYTGLALEAHAMRHLERAAEAQKNGSADGTSSHDLDVS